MRKVVIKISQGSVVTQTVLGGLTIHPPVANFPWCICAKNYENWLRVDKVIAMKTAWFFWPTGYMGLAQNHWVGYNLCNPKTDPFRASKIVSIIDVEMLVDTSDYCPVSAFLTYRRTGRPTERRPKWHGTRFAVANLHCVHEKTVPLDNVR